MRKSWQWISAGLLVAALLCALLSYTVPLAGCAAAKEMNALKAVAEEMSQNISALQVRMNTKIETGGGDVNDPVTGWILAAGYAAVPVSFLGYLLAHRSRRFRSLKERIRGAGATVGRQAVAKTSEDDAG